MLMDVAGLLATATLLFTLIALEVRRAASDTGQTSPADQHVRARRPFHRSTPTRPSFLGRTVSRRAVAMMWTMYLLLLVPRVLGLLA
ncbi:hypothetical protein ACW0JT_22115 [Arthrobacter sp. SA17]